MQVDVRPVARLRGANPVDLPGALGPIVEALRESPVDLSRVRVVCDWIQYRNNFREPVDHRPVLAGEAGLELGVDLRRCDGGVADGVDLATRVKAALAEHAGAAAPGRVELEPWAPGAGSVIWRFNTLYWQALSDWERVTGQEYERTLPGGESDARNVEAAKELIRDLFTLWDDLDQRRALPEELYVVELGVGNGNQARTWLDAFVELDRDHGRDYHRRLRYLMGDYSPHVLERARRAVAGHGERVSALVLDATRPAVTLGFLRGKAFLVYISNVYDNLPSDELATIRGRTYRVEVRAYLPAADAGPIADRFGVGARVEDLGPLVGKLLRLGPELLAEALPRQFPDLDQAVSFWRDVWAALRLRERYVPLDGLDLYEIAPGLTGELLRPLLDADGDIRMHVSNGALSSFAETLPLLHPFGRLHCHDLFVTDPRAYHVGFYGPGKYDGSVVNWVNGALLQLVGNRRGVEVRFDPFKQRPAANVKTLTARVRD